MDARALLTTLRARGVEVTADGDRLRFRPRDRVTPSQVSALVEYKAEIMRFLAAEAGGLRHADGDGSIATPSRPATGAGCSITRAPRHEQRPVSEVRPQDASRLLLAWGLAHDYPPLALKPGVSIATGEMRWRAFATGAPSYLLALVVERVQAEVFRRCVILGCRCSCGDGDPVYCHSHRAQADDGRLWAADAGSEASQEGQNGPAEAPGATQGQNWTLGPTANRTDVLRPLAAGGCVDEVIESLASRVSDDLEAGRFPPAGTRAPPFGSLPEADGGVEIVQSSVAMTSGLGLDALMAALRDRNAQMYVGGRRLHHCGGPLAPDDPVRAAIQRHRATLVEMFTYAPGGRCVAEGCYRLRAEASTTCSDHWQIEEEHPDSPPVRPRTSTTALPHYPMKEDS